MLNISSTSLPSALSWMPLCSRSRVHLQKKNPRIVLHMIPRGTHSYVPMRRRPLPSHRKVLAGIPMLDRDLVMTTHKLRLAQSKTQSFATLVLLATQSSSNLPSSGPFLSRSVIVTRVHHHRYPPRRHTVAGARHYSSSPSPQTCCAYTSPRPVPVAQQYQNPP